MTRLALCLLLLASGASADPLPSGVTVLHDDARGVTCWLHEQGVRGGISCIPDSQLQAGTKRQFSPYEQQDNGPTPAAAPAYLTNERYQL